MKMMTRLDSEIAVCHLSGLMQPWLIARLASMECASLRLNTFSALEVPVPKVDLCDVGGTTTPYWFENSVAHAAAGSS